MSTHAHYDAIVIGGGPEGLSAAAYLSRARWRVLVLEARPELGNSDSILLDDMLVPRDLHSIQPVDTAVARDLKLERYGFATAQRGIPLVALHPAGEHVVLGGERGSAQRSIVKHSKADAETWPRFQRDVVALARAMRPLSSSNASARFPFVPPERLNLLARTSASAWLDRYFESDFLKAALCFDSTGSGLSPLETGSAVTLIWRVASILGSGEGAARLSIGGHPKFVEALIAAAQERGAELQPGARVDRIAMNGGRPVGVELAGETVTARHILSTLSPQKTARLLPRAAFGIACAAAMQPVRRRVAEATILLLSRALPSVAGAPTLASRFVVAPSFEGLVRANVTASCADLLEDLPLEILVPSVMDSSLARPDRHLVSVLVRPVSRPWGRRNSLNEQLISRVLFSLGHFMSGLRENIVAMKVLLPDDALEISDPGSARQPPSPERLRIETPIPGLYFCGPGTGPAGTLSGYAGRTLARMLQEAQP